VDVDLMESNEKPMTGTDGRRGSTATEATTKHREEEQLPPMSVPPSMSKIFKVARPEIPMLVLAMVLMVMSESATLILPIIIANAYDALVNAADPDEDSPSDTMADINRYMGLALALYAASMVCKFFQVSIQGVIGERMVARLRYKLYGAILRQEIAFFDSHKSGELVSRLGSDTTKIQTVLSQAVPESANGLLNVVISVILMFYISPKLAGMTLAGTVVLSLIAGPFGFLLSRLSKEYQDVLGDAQTHSTEALGNMRTVQAFAAEDKELSRFGAKIGNPDVFKWWWPAKQAGRSTYRVGFFKSVTQSTFFTTVFGGGFGFLYVSLWYGFYLVTMGELTLGDLTAFQSYIFTVGFGLGQAAANFALIFEGLGASGRIFYLLERVPEIPKPPAAAPGGGSSSSNNNSDGKSSSAAREQAADAALAAALSPAKKDSGALVPTRMDGNIRFDNVTFSYPSRPDVRVLDGFTLELRENTTTALVGTSGSGKSTVVALIQRFYEILGGNVTIDGNDLQDLDLTWLRRHIGYVQQEPQLFGLSIRENLLYGVEDESTVTQEEIEAICRDANAHEFISAWSTGYDTLVGERGVKLSGGQKQSTYGIIILGVGAVVVLCLELL
jgi:ABC-type multidrug transport system fused ATPase/permease subunit